MPNKNYINGRSKEYRVMNRLKAIGFDIVFRSAGSHSSIDVIGISKKLKLIQFVQCKPKKLSDRKRRDLEIQNIELNDSYRCQFRVI